MTLKDEVETWWSERSEQERARLIAAAEERRSDGATIELLTATRCPDPPVAHKGGDQESYTWVWSEELRDTVLGVADD